MTLNLPPEGNEASFLWLDGLVLEPGGQSLKARVAAGQLAVFVFNREELCREFVDVILSLGLPQAGTVRLFDQYHQQLTEKEQIAAKQRIGIVAARLGLIANLNIWENLVLAADYHAIASHAENFQRAQSLLEFFGYQESAFGTVSRLSVYQQKQVCLARALMLDPDLLIYSSLVDGLSSRESDKLLERVLETHQLKQGRTSVFVTPDHKFVSRLPAQTDVFSLQSEGQM